MIGAPIDTQGWGLAALVVSVLGGVATLALVWRRRFGPARITAALAVAAIVAGWAFAQRPRFLPGLTIQEAAAARPTLVAVLVGLAIGALLLIPSLGLLFALFLRGTFDVGASWDGETKELEPPVRRHGPGPLVALAVLCAVVGTGLTLFSEQALWRAVGILALFAFVASAFVVITAYDEGGPEQTNTPQRGGRS
jgi:cytochrome d ubiquinol oxidase subunit II